MPNFETYITEQFVIMFAADGCNRSEWKQRRESIFAQYASSGDTRLSGSRAEQTLRNLLRMRHLFDGNVVEI